MLPLPLPLPKWLAPFQLSSQNAVAPQSPITKTVYRANSHHGCFQLPVQSYHGVSFPARGVFVVVTLVAAIPSVIPAVIPSVCHPILVAICRSTGPEYNNEDQKYVMSDVLLFISLPLVSAVVGNVLDSIVSRNKHFQTDQCYLAHIQSTLLQLASKAFLYYHSYCLNSPNSHLINSTSSADSTIRQNSSPARVNSASFLSKLGLVDGDCKIVEYWVELIKRQQLDEIMHQQGYTEIPSPSIRLDHRVCSRYQM
nr:uncharacterized protein LOC129259558 [Lytechinus pictus]